MEKGKCIQLSYLILRIVVRFCAWMQWEFMAVELWFVSSNSRDYFYSKNYVFKNVFCAVHALKMPTTGKIGVSPASPSGEWGVGVKFLFRLPACCSQMDLRGGEPLNF